MFRVCANCGLNFEIADTQRKKYCSAECQKKKKCKRQATIAKKNAIERICKHCGLTYVRLLEKAGFCSRSCGSKWNIEHGKFDSWRLREQEKTGEYKKCSNIACNEKVYWLPRFLKNPHATVYCSKDCSSAGFSNKMSGENNPRKRHPYTEETKLRQKQTLQMRYGVENGFAFAKHRQTSKPQKLLFEQLSVALPNHQFQLEKFVPLDKHGYYVDIICEDTNMIIEYYGDYWHCNPAKHAADFVNHKKKMTASEIWQRDAARCEKLRKAGYHVFVVWATDYAKNSANVIDKLKDYILIGKYAK